eukprot:4189199-Amphidinium_carterae.1
MKAFGGANGIEYAPIRNDTGVELFEADDALDFELVGDGESQQKRRPKSKAKSKAAPKPELLT